jgi:ubiquinone/menaquinone biosynthesis C-methylase UbiE
MAKRLALISSFTPLRGRKILDCGCGAGEYLLALEAAGAEVWGVEQDREKVAIFTSRCPASGKISVGDLECLNYQSESFDAALLNEVLEHVTAEGVALGEIHRVLKKGGLLFVFSPNRLYPFETHGVFLKASRVHIPPYIPFVPYIPVRAGRKFFSYWARNYWPSELRALVRDSGFEILSTSYIWQTFENISGHQPWWIRGSRKMLRRVANLMENLPVVRAMGTSQVIVAQKS